MWAVRRMDSSGKLFFSSYPNLIIVCLYCSLTCYFSICLCFLPSADIALFFFSGFLMVGFRLNSLQIKISVFKDHIFKRSRIISVINGTKSDNIIKSVQQSGWELIPSRVHSKGSILSSCRTIEHQKFKSFRKLDSNFIKTPFLDFKILAFI